MNNIQEILDKIGSSPIANAFGPRFYSIQKQRPIYQFDVNGNIVRRFDSIIEAKKLGFRGVNSALQKKYLCHGYYFSYESEINVDDYNNNLRSFNYIKSIDVYDLDGNFLYTQKSSDFIKDNNISSGQIASYFSVGNKKIAKKFMIRKSVDNPPTKIESYKRGWKKHKVGKFDLNNNLIEEYESILDASKANGIPHPTLLRWIKNNFVKNNCVFKKIP